MNEYKLQPEEHEVLCSMEKITTADVQSVMQKFSSGKVKTPEIGKLRIVNKFIPMVKNTGISQLMDFEGKFVFFAVEKFKASLFSKASYRVFIWPFLSEKVFAVPTESAVFEPVRPKIESRNQAIVEKTYVRKVRWCGDDPVEEFRPTQVIAGFEKIPVKVWPSQAAVLLTVEQQQLADYGENLQSCEFSRRFMVRKEQILVEEDFAVYYVREKSGGCRSNTQKKEAMYYLRHGFALS